MKYKEQIIGVVILCAVLGAMGAVWQFHFKEIFEQYRADDTMREALERSVKQLEETFQGYKPELLIEEWQNKLQPWRNAREDRATFFNFGGWFETEATPDDTRILKFWYNEELEKRTGEVYQKVFAKMGGYELFPQNILDIFDIYRGEEVTGGDVRLNFAYLRFATALTEFLLDSNVTSVQSIVCWPRRRPNMYAQLLLLQTVGVQFTISARDLVRMIDNLRQEPRYFSVEGIKITYPYIAYDMEPQLNVSLLLTQAHYLRPEDEPDGVTPGIGAPGAPPSTRPVVTTRPKEPGALGKFWIWFKRTILYMN